MTNRIGDKFKHYFYRCLPLVRLLPIYHPFMDVCREMDKAIIDDFKLAMAPSVTDREMELNEILGGIADWLHENGIKTSYDVAYEEYRRQAMLPIFKLSSHYLGIYSAGDKSDSVYCLEGGNFVLMNAAVLMNDSGELYMLISGLSPVQWSFELADPGFLDDLLSKVR